ncbi:MAG: beta-ketoacyl-ACP synthase II [Verrucomicrobiota bacterium]
MERRVVITGLGLVTSSGCDLDTFWSNMVEGRSGIQRITTFDPSRSRCQVGGEIPDFNASEYFRHSRDAKRAERFIQFSVAASKMAVAHAGIEFAEMNPERAGAILGTGVGGLRTIEETQRVFMEKGPGKVSPFTIPMMIGNAAGGIVAQDFEITGPNYCVTSACATGNHAIGEAWKTILLGDAEVMISGGSESAVTELAYAGFGNMRALSSRNDEPEKASRPFDRDRDGFVMGEGAGVVVLEELEHALARGADILAEMIGYGTSADAFHSTLPHPEGRGASQCMNRAMRRAKLNPEQVDYINAHGTATPQGDIAETKAIKTSFGEHSRNGLSISSTKSMTGHLLGAAGGVELAVCALALRDQVVPPTINLDHPDPECDLDYIAHEAREAKVDATLSNSFGFGGTNGSIILSRFRG